MNQIVIGLLIALGATVVGSGLAIWYLDGKLTAANEDLITSESAHAAEVESRSEFEAASKTCSAATEALEKRSADAEEKYATAQAEAAKRARTNTAYINDLLTRARAAGMDECAAVRKELDDEVDRRHPAR